MRRGPNPSSGSYRMHWHGIPGQDGYTGMIRRALCLNDVVFRSATCPFGTTPSDPAERPAIAPTPGPARARSLAWRACRGSLGNWRDNSTPAYTTALKVDLRTKGRLAGSTRICVTLNPSSESAARTLLEPALRSTLVYGVQPNTLSRTPLQRES